MIKYKNQAGPFSPAQLFGVQIVDYSPVLQWQLQPLRSRPMQITLLLYCQQAFFQYCKVNIAALNTLQVNRSFFGFDFLSLVRKGKGVFKAV